MIGDGQREVRRELEDDAASAELAWARETGAEDDGPTAADLDAEAATVVAAARRAARPAEPVATGADAPF